jgi:hypothetical protein
VLSASAPSRSFGVRIRISTPYCSPDCHPQEQQEKERREKFF